MKNFSFLQLSHIRNLSINLHFETNLWKDVPVFSRLLSITILSTDTNASFHLQSLLDRSPCLDSLTIQSWPSSKKYPPTSERNAAPSDLTDSTLVEDAMFT